MLIKKYNVDDKNISGTTTQIGVDIETRVIR
jgi:hypothetical protein